MVRKKKICAGCNQESYIYKNIDGKKYCKSCSFKLQPPKPIKMRTEKQIFKIELKKRLLQEDMEFYIKVWYERFGRVEGTSHYNSFGLDNCVKMPKCESCGKRLFFEPNLTYFHHILEKRNYPQYRHKEWNIAIVCSDCHNSYEAFPDSISILKKKRDLLIEQIEREEITKQILQR